MGTDIHFVVERKFRDKWVGIFFSDPAWRVPGHDKPDVIPACSRNYARFAMLASVRGESKRKPIGIPHDASDLTDLVLEDPNRHSMSWMPLMDFLKICFETDSEDRKKMLESLPKDGNEFEFLKDHYIEYYSWGSVVPDEYRIIFWFDS